MKIVYHGSSVLFDRFDLSHVMEGDGKIKFGYGVYVTEKYGTGAHYAYNKSRPDADTFYVYTIRIPDVDETNTLFFDPGNPVSSDVLSKVEKQLGEKIPGGNKFLVKELRRYLANRLTGRELPPRKMTAADVKDAAGEKAAALFFSSIGYVGYRWPVSWIKPDEWNYAIFDEKDVEIIKVEKVRLDDKHHLIDGSQTKMEGV